MKKIILILFLFSVCTRAYGQSMASEAAIKAAYIFHFINFTEWSDDLSDYYVCVPHDKDLQEALETALQGKLIHNRHIVVAHTAPACHVLISDQPENENSENTLTIGLVDEGALFEFRIINNKLKFIANLEKIKMCKLKISSQLLKLALPRGNS